MTADAVGLDGPHYAKLGNPVESMRPQDIIARKRDGRELAPAEIEAFIAGVCDGSWADYQISALLMAMFIRGLSDAETEMLVRAMVESGRRMDFSDIGKPVADKHSTGGVGDKTSLIIAPIAAACGLAVPMISGRGLGHTGGTLDKLESIPGYRVHLSPAEFHRIVEECGFAMSGQTDDIAPADRKLYALRDATATVPYIPLIVASIMSKKLAEGLDALVLDVKTGSGAFMKEIADARNLARRLSETGGRFGVATEAIISDMSRPLGRYIGNSLEVYECIKILRNEPVPGSETTLELSLELSASMLTLCGHDGDSARRAVDECVRSGNALEAFRRNVELQGGDVTVCDRPDVLLETSLIERPIKASDTGFVVAIDTAAIGNVVVSMGGGRIKAEDDIDRAVGVSFEAMTGNYVKAGEVIGTVYARTESAAEASAKAIADAVTIGASVADTRPLIIERIRTDEVLCS